MIRICMHSEIVRRISHAISSFDLSYADYGYLIFDDAYCRAPHTISIGLFSRIFLIGFLIDFPKYSRNSRILHWIFTIPWIQISTLEIAHSVTTFRHSILRLPYRLPIDRWRPIS